MKKPLRNLLVSLALITLYTSCEAVKPYQRVYLNDQEMKLGQPGVRGFEDNVETYREGAVGGRGKKSSGGCGCN